VSTAPRRRIFLLSPAHCGGRRAQIIMSEKAQFELAQRLREPGGAALGEIFSFVSGLYFRGKLAYAERFAQPPASVPGVFVITPHRGLLSPAIAITLAEMYDFADVPVDLAEVRYRLPLERAAQKLCEQIDAECDIVLLGSVATAKYTEVLLSIFGERLVFPAEFVGRGDMSRGGLMLRCADSGTELEYVKVAGAVRHGPRPPKLEKRKRRAW
jgi:hypothetical protein